MAKFNWDENLPPAKWEKKEDPDYWERRRQQARFSSSSGILIGKDLSTGLPFHISPSQLSTHMHVLGASGVGKSFFLEGILKLLILQGQGVCLIDPHGDLYHRLLEFCTWLHFHHPEKGIAQRLIPFDIAERQHIFGFNPVARNARVMTYQVVALIEAIRKVWGQESFDSTPRLARWLFNTAYAIIERELTLLQAKHLIDPKPNEQREAIAGRIQNPDIRAEWDYISALREKERNEFMESSFNRLRPFVMNEVISLIVGRKERVIDFPSLLNDRKILLVNLARQNTIADDYQQMLGTMLVNEILTAAFARPRGQRAPFFLAIDEFSRFVTKDICEILDGGRKFGLHLILAHQHLNQLKQKDPEVYYSTLINARLKSVFGGLGEEDLDLMSRELFTGELDPDLVKQEIWHSVFEPVETTRTITSYSDSSSSGSSYGNVSHYSLQNSELYIPGSGLFASPELTSTTSGKGSGSGRSEARQESYSSGSTTTEVPWYEFHKTSELSSREFRHIEEQLFIKKAQLKLQPNQHHTFLMPDKPVQILKTGTLKDYGKKITDRQRVEFMDEIYNRAGIFDSPERILLEQQAMEDRLLKESQPQIIIETTVEAEAEPEPRRKPRTRPKKPKQNPYEAVPPLSSKDPDSEE